ncbi:Zn-dependent hydrolase [Loigolactobacillus bifermentans]|uniref:N-carbamoyl-L-amino-acid hydrolase n=1 Tax=Loigolactobacillus bifermentans DSM 20003 TaxID=1423726 RepID=A0A0R1H7Y5_9LACO|nr:Zn-dependent hydrolase [Loigolactobacillus bifermentans]KRK39642.1 N-carbamoyl-L-amino-acid hydrolase [Loigolactobacillus bifermentans DSM 20003]QGG60736.1 hydantoinase/carbamoylase family amidase [Loigolactobacillus bifermentans]
MKVNAQRFLDSFKALQALFPEDGGDEGYNRPAFSAKEQQAHAWVSTQLQQSGVVVTHDPIRNTFGRYGQHGGPAIGFGSHLDTVNHGGLYDGAYGTLAALEVIRSAAEQALPLQRDLLFTNFVGEEVNPLGGTFGSRALTGQVPVTDNDYFTAAQIQAAQLAPQTYRNFLELHIEQSSALEQQQVTIGIPTAIAGIVRYEYQFSGAALHAGATPMAYRDDALVKASRFIQAVSQQARASSEQLVATVGQLSVQPNQPTVIPGQVTLILEVRAVDMQVAYQFQHQLDQWLKAAQIDYHVRKIVDKVSAQLDPQVQQVIQAAAEQRHDRYTKLFSGANHDVNAMSKIAAAGLIFVPSHLGISHNPQEFTTAADLVAGLQVLADSVYALATE